MPHALDRELRGPSPKVSVSVRRGYRERLREVAEGLEERQSERLRAYVEEGLREDEKRLERMRGKG